MIKKIPLFLTVSLLFISQLSALNISINEDSVKAYREALVYFDSQDYGKALNLCEDAILYRKTLSQNHRKVLENSMKARRVQKAGKEISSILSVLEERNEKESISIIKYYYSRKGEAFFENSIDRLLSYIEEIQEFPEAQCLIGDIYLLEGEYLFAEKYYQLAISNAKVLDVPDQKYELYLKLARISELTGDYNQMEVRLLSVLTEDKSYTDKALFSAMLNTVSLERPDSMEKFFQLYRANNYYCLEAYTKLCNYYYSLGEIEKALNFSLLSVLTEITRIEEVTASRNIEFSYKNLGDLLTEASLYSDILDWCNREEVWKSIKTFCEIQLALDHKVFTKSLLKVLVENCPESYWQKNYVIMLGKL